MVQSTWKKVYQNKYLPYISCPLIFSFGKFLSGKVFAYTSFWFRSLTSLVRGYLIQRSMNNLSNHKISCRTTISQDTFLNFREIYRIKYIFFNWLIFVIFYWGKKGVTESERYTAFTLWNAIFLFFFYFLTELLPF
jgi:hypothetical protein